MGLFIRRSSPKILEKKNNASTHFSYQYSKYNIKSWNIGLLLIAK